MPLVMHVRYQNLISQTAPISDIKFKISLFRDPTHTKGIHAKFKNVRMRENVPCSNETCNLIGLELSRDLVAMVASDILTHSYSTQ